MCSKAQHGFDAIGSRLVCELQKITIFPFVCKLALLYSAVSSCLPDTIASFSQQSAALPPSATHAVTDEGLRESEPPIAPCRPAEAHQHLAGRVVAQVIITNLSHSWSGMAFTTG